VGDAQRQTLPSTRDSAAELVYRKFLPITELRMQNLRIVPAPLAPAATVVRREMEFVVG